MICQLIADQETKTLRVPMESKKQSWQAMIHTEPGTYLLRLKFEDQMDRVEDNEGLGWNIIIRDNENNIAKVDHAVVQRLKAAGCVILGITNTPEYGHKGITENQIFGTTKNPWDLGKTTGGSSGGAAASVVSGLSPLALGSDGGGSIRIPSSLCGCYGLKPNFGRVPRYPFSGAAWATISHFGPLVRYVEDAALMLDVIKGPHPADFYSPRR